MCSVGGMEGIWQKRTATELVGCASQSDYAFERFSHTKDGNGAVL